MEITEANADGLKRELQVVVGATELNERFTVRLSEMQKQAHLKGFRKGHVPTAHLKKVYGKSLMAEVVQQAVTESSSKAIKDRDERPAFQPDIALPEDEAEIEKVMGGEADLAYKISFEVLPTIEMADMTKLNLERFVVEADDKTIDEMLESLVDRNTTFEPNEERKAEDGDQVTMDFVGKIDGEAFEGGSGEGINLVLGSASFIPGFEDGLQGAKAGDALTIDATFPDDYQADHLAGKAATFDVKVKEVGTPLKPEISDAFAVTLGVENLEKLKDLLRERLTDELRGEARQILKRQLLDELDKAHNFELPPSLVDREFEQVWTQLKQSMEQSKSTFEDEGKSEDESKTEYRKIAERRVRLGLLISDIGEKNKIAVTQDELRNAMVERARGFPGQEKMVFEYFEKHPDAINELRAPIFEDKVVDFVLELAKPIEKSVTRDELKKEIERLQNADAAA